MASDGKEIGFVQLALNTADIAGLLRLYHELFGFANAGSNVAWEDALRIQDLGSDVHCLVWWMVGPAPFFQLELFHHGRPKQRPLPDDWRPSDHGWVRFGVAVNDFDRVVKGLKRYAIEILGTAGAQPRRRLAFRDPYAGVIVEVMEGAAAQCPDIVYATSSVADLPAARRFYEGVVGADIKPLDALHQPEDENLWGLGAAQRDGFLVNLGGRFLEILSYRRPVGRPQRVGHLTSDQGIMNIGVGSRDAATVRALIERAQASGRRTTGLFQFGGAVATYLTEPGYEFEFLAVPRELDAALGFTRVGPFPTETDKGGGEAAIKV